MTESAAHVRVIEETSAYWRVVFDYPPFNIVDATIFEGLEDLLARMDPSPSLRVVVFESANPEFYLAHFYLTGILCLLRRPISESAQQERFEQTWQWQEKMPSSVWKKMPTRRTNHRGGGL